MNLSGLTVDNATIKGIKIFGYGVKPWIKEQLGKGGCHPGAAARTPGCGLQAAAASRSLPLFGAWR